MKSLQNAEKERRTRAKKRAAFVQKPYKFTKAASEEDEKTGVQKATKEEIEEHIRQSHSDFQRDEPLGECSRVLQAKTSAAILDNKEPIRGRKLVKLSKRQDFDQHLDLVGFHKKFTRSVQNSCVDFGNSSRSHGEKESSQNAGK